VHQHASAALLFALLVLIALWPALVGGKILSPISVLYRVAPWQAYRPPGSASFENYLLADVPLTTFPWREFTRTLIRAGTLPAWNPHILTGVPFASNPESGLFTPFSLPLWILPLTYGLGVTAALMLWTGAFGTYLLVRELELGFLPGLLAGVAFAFCSMNVTWLTPQIVPGVSMLLPWMVWLAERAIVRGSPRAALGLALATAVALGGGHPGTQVHVLFAAGGYALLRAALLPAAPTPLRLRRLALAAGGLVLGTLLMFVLLLPEIRSSHGTVGTLARQHGHSTLPGAAHMPFAMARTILFPDWWGRPSAYETTNSPEATMLLNYEERTFYAGVVTLLLAAVAVSARGAWRPKAPFLVLGALGLAIAVHTPGLFQLVERLPVLELVENQRLHFVFEFALAVLGGFGLQALLDRPRGDPARFAVPLVALAATVVAAATAGAHAGDLGRVVRHFATGADFPRSGVVALTSVAWFALFALGVAVALVCARRWPQRRAAIATALVLLAALDMLHFAHGYNPMGPASQIIPPRTPAIAYLARHARDGRFLGIELELPPDWSMRYGLNDVRSYDPPFPTQRFYDLWRTASPDQVAWQPLTIDALTPATVRMTAVLGARYVLADPKTSAPGGRDPALRALRRVYAGRDATIFENPRAAPRALVAPSVALVASEPAARAALVAPRADPRRTIVLERDQPGAAEATGARGTATIVDEQNARVTMRASLDRRGLVVLNDQLTPGWRVSVDGRPAQALRVEDVMRGVIVDAGRHTVVWRYTTPGLRTGALVSLAALLALLASGAALALRARRRVRAG
jgi:hypothetical protein